MFGAALAISGLAFLVGAFFGHLWGPATNEYPGLYAAGGALILVGLAALFFEARSGSLPHGRLVGEVAPPDPETPGEVAALIYDVAGKAFSSQAEQWQDVRGRIATLTTIGPAAAAVIVATTNTKFDLIALISLFLLLIATLVSIRALNLGTNYRPSVALEDNPPPSTTATVLQLALAARINEVRVQNSSAVKLEEELFRLAAMSFLAAVLMWAIHAATDSHVLFTLS